MNIATVALVVGALCLIAAMFFIGLADERGVAKQKRQPMLNIDQANPNAITAFTLVEVEALRLGLEDMRAGRIVPLPEAEKPQP